MGRDASARGPARKEESGKKWIEGDTASPLAWALVALVSSSLCLSEGEEMPRDDLWHRKRNTNPKIRVSSPNPPPSLPCGPTSYK